MVNLEKSKNNEIDDDSLAKKILHWIESRISEKNKLKSNYGEMTTDDPVTDRYYIVE